MEFNEKLQKLRKEHNITQEGLADKLNVSRQAVSKWESGSAYPDMEKLISLSRIFNISLDDLVNDKELVSKEKCVKKMDFKDMIDKVIEFISKSINMFWSMKFSEKIKFLFEMGIIVLMTLLIAYVTTEIICSIFREILTVLPSDIYMFIMTLISSLLSIIWMILGVIVVIKVFKDRYLDYYLVVDKDMENNKFKLSIKNIDYRNDGRILNDGEKFMDGFEPLKDHLELWINEKIKEIMDKM